MDVKEGAAAATTTATMAITLSEGQEPSAAAHNNNSGSGSDVLELIGGTYNDERKWAGMVQIGDCLYCIPYNAEQILKIDPSTTTSTTTTTTSLVGMKHPKGGFKWRNGFVIDNILYGIPYCASHILKYNVETDETSFVGGNPHSLGTDYGKWMSAAVVPAPTVLVTNDATNDSSSSSSSHFVAYFLPYYHNRIVKFNPIDETTEFVGNPIEGFGFNYTATIAVALKPHDIHITIDDDNNNDNDNDEETIDKQSVSLLSSISTSNSSDTLQPNLLLSPPSSSSSSQQQSQKYYYYLYGIPDAAKRVLKFDPSTNCVSYIGPTFNGRKWCGATAAMSSMWYATETSLDTTATTTTTTTTTIYGIPYSADQFLKIQIIVKNNSGDDDDDDDDKDTEINETVEFVGPNLSKYGRWKFHGAETVNKDIYCIPHNAKCIVKYNTITDTITEIGDNDSEEATAEEGTVTAVLKEKDNKWSGGHFFMNNGCIYTVPSDASKVLQIRAKPSEIAATTAATLPPYSLKTTLEEDEHVDKKKRII